MEEDMHMCLICQTTINGLMNYINHKKNECSGKKGMKGEPQVQPTQQSQNPDTHSDNVQCLTQKYDSHQYNTDFHNFGGGSSSHSGMLEFASSHVDSNEDRVNKGMSLDSVLYPGQDIKSSLFEQQVTNIVITSTQNTLDIPVPPSLNLSPSIFRPELTSMTSAMNSSGLHEDHGLLDGCITNEHLHNEFNAGIAYPGMNPVTEQHSPSTIISDIITDNPNKEEDNQTTSASEKVDDFFESLELMSKNDPRAEKGTGFGQPLTNLPISNILSNLTFSSDEEEFSFDFADDVSFDGFSDDSDIEINRTSKVNTLEHPSSRNRPRFRGKWPPGQGPTEKVQALQPKLSKGGKKFPPETFKKANKSFENLKPIKTFTCSVCNVSFGCRFKYSNHFGSVEHKQSLLNRRNTKSEGRPFKIGKGKSFKLIREVNKQFENDPFSQSFSQDPTVPNEQEKSGDFIEENEHSVDAKLENKDSVCKPQENGEYSESQPESKEKDLQNDQKECSDESVKTDVILECSEENKTEDIYGKGLDEIKEVNKNETLQEDQNQPDDDISETSEPRYRAVPIHICTICDRKYPNKYYLSCHLITNFHRKRAKSHPEEAFSLLQHYQKYIIRLSPYQCAICRFYFNRYDEFVKHLTSEGHTLVQETLIAEMLCSLCKFKTHYNEEMLQHFLAEEHISNIKKRNKICIVKESHYKGKCRYCGLVMKSYTRLRQHVQLKHKNKQYIPAVKRQIGVRNRPFCSVCSQQFASKSTLELHFRRRHTKERPYNCQVCKKVFADKHAFKIHQRTSRHLKKIIEGKSEVGEIKGEHDSQNAGKQDSKMLEKSSTGIVGNTSLAKSEFSIGTDGMNGDNETEEKYEVVQVKDDKDQILVKSSDDKETVKKEWIPTIKIKLPIDTKQENNVKKKRRRRQPNPVEKTFKCNHCSFTVKAYNDLRPHYLKEHAAQTIICELCDIVFLSDKAMKLHILSKEHQANINRTSLVEKKDEVKYFDCHVCKKKFTDEKYCKFHTAYQHFHITSEEGLIKEYGENSITRERFKQVLEESEELPTTARIQCPECKVSFKKPNFLEHLRIHTSERPFKCKICPKAFMASVTLRKHLLGHFGCQERTCEICNKHFKKADSYEEHMQVHAAQKISMEKTHTCDTCGMSFYLAKQLQNHIRRHKDREFKCTVPGCHWKFLFANELKYHMQTHSQQKPFLCDICGYAAASKSRLKRHHKTHTGERNFHCEYCSYKAGNSTHLHRHMRIHIGSKPFKCPYCEYTCNTHENMRKHIVQTKKHEGLKIYPCKFCDYGTNSCADFRNHLMEKHEGELGPHIKLMNGLSKFTGLYNKELDPKKPQEGKMIHQVKERTPRLKKPKDDSDRLENKTAKVKVSRKTKLANTVTEVLIGSVMDVSNFHDEDLNQSTSDSGIGPKPTDGKHNKEHDLAKQSTSEMKSKSNLNFAYVNSAQDRQTNKIESFPSADSMDSHSNEMIPVNEYYGETTGLNLTFGQDYQGRAAETIPKQMIVNMHAPTNYRSLLKMGNNIPVYQTYNTYSDQQSLGSSSHGFQTSFSGIHANTYLSGRVENVSNQMVHENHNQNSKFGVGNYIQTPIRASHEEKNLIIDLGFQKKN